MRKLFFVLLLLLSNSMNANALVSQTAITTNMKNFRPINNLLEIDDDYKLVYFFAEFKRPIAGIDGIEYTWLYNGQVMTRQTISTSSNVWWNAIHVSKHGTWVAIITQYGNILTKNTFIYHDIVPTDKIFNIYTFQELLNLKANQRCGEMLLRLSVDKSPNDYFKFLLEGWQKNCLVDNGE